ncbi:MAG: sigma-70 family RNA polymerase sigma factor [Bacteroidota bacterium]
MISRTSTDEQLIEESRNGDQRAFAQLVEKYEQQVAGTVIGMLGNGQEAEDVGQEVFIRFYRSLDKFRGDSSLGTYLTRIAINLSLNTVKKQKRRKLFSLFGSRENHPVLQIPDHGLTQDELNTQNLVQTALQMLDIQFRSVLVLRLIDGYSTKETAELLDLPLGTVLSRLSRGQKKLKEILQKLGANS